MTVGLPGVGLGGIFYLVSAILMPVREAARRPGRGTDARRRRLVVRQTAMAGTILAALWATGWLLGRVMAAAAPTGIGIARGVSAVPRGNLLQVSALALSLGTLLVVLATVQGARLIVRLQSARETQGKQPSNASMVAEQMADLRVDSGTFGRTR